MSSDGEIEFDDQGVPYVQGFSVPSIYRRHVAEDMRPPEIAGKLGFRAHDVGNFAEEANLCHSDPLENHEISTEDVETALEYARNNESEVRQILKEKVLVKQFWSRASQDQLQEALDNLEELGVEYICTDYHMEDETLVYDRF